MSQAIAKRENRTITALAKKPETGVASPQLQSAKPASDDAVRLRAYQRWEAAGMPEGDGVNFWLEAERELLQPK
jgi:hypothetical protein